MGHLEGNGREVPSNRIRRHDILCAYDLGHQAEPSDADCSNLLAIQEEDARHLCTRRAARDLLHHLARAQGPHMLANICILAG